MSEKIVQLNEEVIKGELKELVRGSVEETLNELLEAEAEKLTQAARYERNEQRQGDRSGCLNRRGRLRRLHFCAGLSIRLQVHRGRLAKKLMSVLPSQRKVCLVLFTSGLLV